jgi:hypothetical protein
MRGRASPGAGTSSIVSLAREALWQAGVGVERERRLRKFESRVGIDMRPEDKRAILEDYLQLMTGACAGCGEALTPRQRSLGKNLCRRCTRAASARG